MNAVLAEPPTSWIERSCSRAVRVVKRNAAQFFEQWRATGDQRWLDGAWLEYRRLFYQVREVTQALWEVETADVSEWLDTLDEKRQLPIPGGRVPIITEFAKRIKIWDSKQRPRKLTFTGSDGEKAIFLLKAHEDTRLDERVQQLFEFVNIVTRSSRIARADDLFMTTYRVIPIKPDVGLIRFVPDCKTAFDVVREYRTELWEHKEKRAGHDTAGIDPPIDTEYQAAVAKDPDFSEEQEEERRIPAFRAGLAASDSHELRRIFVRRSPSSREWLERRARFTGSLAAYSMVGYILGLGDRHLQNVMLQNHGGRVVHVDFGDCFESCRDRPKAPELVPFRLTPMFVANLEPMGKDGSFRSLCTKLMSRFRESVVIEPICGLLDIFRRDPIEHEQFTRHGIEEVLRRVEMRLRGTPDVPVKQQVIRLIEEATCDKNLSAAFVGWYSWW